MRPPLSYVPALFPLVGFIAGMLVCEMAGYLWIPVVIISGVALIVARRRLPVWTLPLGGMLLFCGLGGADMSCNRLPDVNDDFLSRGQWSGEVLEISENDRGIHMVVRSDDTTGVVADMLVHTLHGVADGVVPGDIVSFHGTLDMPSNDKVTAGADYAGILARRGIVATGFSEEISVDGHYDSWRYLVWRMRREAASLLMRSSLSGETCQFLAAVIVGEDDWLSPDTREAFSTAGVAHVLALSGLHVGILVMILGFLLFPLGLLWDWRVRCGVVIAALWIYAFLSGMSASVTRAALMASMVCGGIILQRPYMSFNGMLVSALMILIVSPRQLWMPGFQMSYLAVGCILLVMPVVLPWVRRAPWCMRWLLLTVAISLSAMLGTGMIAMYYFDIFPVYFLLANIPVAMILPIVMAGGIAVMVCEAVGSDPAWLCSAVDGIYDVMLRWIELITSLPASAIYGVNITWYAMVSYYVTLCLGLVALWRRSVGWSISLAVMVLVTVFVGGVTSEEEEQWFIPHDAYFTTIICRMPSDGGDVSRSRVEMLTTAPDIAAESLRDEYAERYRKFVGHPTSAAEQSISIVRGNTVVLPACDGTTGRLVIVNHDSILSAPCYDGGIVDCALICRGYRGGWQTVVDSLRPCRILLSADIPKRRHMRMLDSILSCSQIPVISLRDVTLSSSDLPDIFKKIE